METGAWDDHVMGDVDGRSRRRRSVIAAVVFASALALAALVAVIALVVVPAVRTLFPGTSADCFGTVNSVASELQVTSAGHVLSTETRDTGSFNDCSAPQFNATLEGPQPASTLKAKLGRDGFALQIPGVWERASDSTRVRIEVVDGDTHVVIDVV
jgi:hypothetical protein